MCSVYEGLWFRFVVFEFTIIGLGIWMVYAQHVVVVRAIRQENDQVISIYEKFKGEVDVDMASLNWGLSIRRRASRARLKRSDDKGLILA